MLITLMFLLTSPAFADEELSPTGGSAPTVVRSAEGGGVYHPIAPDGVLSYDVTGPVTLEVNIRQRLPTASAPVDTIKVAAKGDGMLILTVKLKGGPDSGSILDATGGVPTVADRAEITVPPGQHVFTLEPIEAPYPLLARVTALTGDDGPPAVAVLEDPPEPVVEREVVELFGEEPTEPVAEPAGEREVVELFGEEAEDAAFEEELDAVLEADLVVDVWGDIDTDEPETKELEDLMVVEEPPDEVPVVELFSEEPEDAAFEEELDALLEADLVVDVWGDIDTDEPETKELEDLMVVEEPPDEVPVVDLFSDEVEDDIEVVEDVHDSFVPEVHEPSFEQAKASGPDLALGARLGLGASGGGNQASLYLGLEAIVGTPSPSMSVAVRVGRYGVSYAEALPLQPAIGGYQGVAEGIDWQTNVRTMEVAARVSPPLEMPLDMRPYGMAGIAAYFSTRIDGTQKTRSLGGGTTWALGLDIPAGPGIIAPELAINTGRQSFDNTNITGGEARERVGGFRGNVSYRYVF